MKPETVVDKELEAQFRLLEKKIDAALELIGRLRREKKELEERLAEAVRLRQEAVRQLNTFLDRIDALL
uniref:Cell division protein ZapB n=1 Tax=candidate division WOR-3 bacterium TaxID=2052148 RepID=A0A7C4GDT1_UNCW3